MVSLADLLAGKEGGLPHSLLSNLLPTWPLPIGPLAASAIVLVAAALGGEVIQRFLHLPRITGYSLVGLVAGPTALGWIGPEEIEAIRVVVDLSLSLLLFELGIRVDLGWFRHNPLILASSLGEAATAFALSFATVIAFGYSLELALAVATISIATSPATVMRMAAEARARGQVTDRMLTLTALNLVYAVILAQLLLGFLHQSYGRDWLTVFLHPFYLLTGSLFGGFILAQAFRLLRRYLDPQQEQSSAILFGCLLLLIAGLEAARLPVLLAPLLAGILVRNTDPRPHLWPPHFGTAGGFLVIVLFIVSGATLSWTHIAVGGAAALALLALRCAGKLAGVAAFGRASGLTGRQAVALGVTLCPMSGIAFVLTADIGRLYPTLGAELGGIVMTMVAVLELLGPIAIQKSLEWVGESGGPDRGA